MKYNDNGEIKELNLKVMDTLPVGAEIEYNGNTIPEGWEVIDDIEDYSIEERYIGKHWIDGKKIYKKTIVYNKASGVSEVGIPHNITNLETPIKFEGMSNIGGSWRPVPVFYSSDVGTYNQGIYTISSTEISYTGSYWYTNRSMILYITLYYTKSTN